MKIRSRRACFNIVASVLLLVSGPGVAAQRTSESNHPYFSGQPLSVPSLFAQGVINTPGDEYGPTFTPDGKTVYFAKRVERGKQEFIYYSRYENGSWTAPKVAEFSGRFYDKEPFISPDGSKLYFASTRAADGTAAGKDFNIWVVEKSGSGWGDPKNLGPVVNSPGYDNYPAVASNGTLYFGSIREGGKGEGDLYRSRLVDGKYAAPENLGEVINTASTEADPYIAPDESYLIFSSERPGGLGEGDLYISFNRNGSWTKPKTLGPKINSGNYEYTPLVSPDGKYLFFSRGWGDIYQIDFSIVMEAAQSPEPAAKEAKTEASAQPSPMPAMPLPALDEVLEKYIKAIGGRAALEKLTTRMIKGRFESQAMGVSVLFESYEQAPNKFVHIVNLPNDEVVWEGFNGTKGWLKNSGRGYQEIKEPLLAKMEREADLRKSLRLKELYPGLAVKGVEKMGDRTVYVLGASPPGSIYKLYFDAESGLLLRLVEESASESGKVLADIYYEDYREVDGIKLPFTVRRDRPMKFSTVIVELKHNVEINPKRFDEPMP